MFDGNELTPVIVCVQTLAQLQQMIFFFSSNVSTRIALVFVILVEMLELKKSSEIKPEILCLFVILHFN